MQIPNAILWSQRGEYMIEIVYNKGKEKTTGNEEYFCIPKNIRQIGEISKETKIYLEDYVYTYLTSDWQLEETKGRIAILLGSCDWKNGTVYIFIKSAVLAEQIAVSKDCCPLTDEIWGDVYEDMKNYFPGQEVVGWYLAVPDGGLKVTDTMIRTHNKHFGGNDKVLLLADPYECESCFYIYRNNRMEKESGYYIFYEKNNQMQEYMLDKNPQVQRDYAGKAQDRAVQDFRKIIAKKQEERKEKEKGISWGLVAGTGAVALVLVAGIFIYNSKYWIRTDAKKEPEVQETLVDAEDAVLEHSVKNKNDEKDMVLLTPVPSENIAAEERKKEKTDELVKTKEKEEQNNLEEELKIDEGEKGEETAVSVYTKYTVRKGDTLSKISMRYYGDFSKIAEICKINNMLEDDIIRVGQTILLP